MSLDQVYNERNRLVAFLAKIFPSYLALADEQEEGWSYIVYIDTPKGQLSWHVPDSEAITLFKDLSVLPNKWDGHTTEEKYRRLDALDINDVVW